MATVEFSKNRKNFFFFKKVPYNLKNKLQLVYNKKNFFNKAKTYIARCAVEHSGMPRGTRFDIRALKLKGYLPSNANFTKKL